MLRGLYFIVIAMILTASARSQIPNTLPNPTNPNPFNQDIEQRQKIEEVNRQQARESANAPPQVAKFMEAIRPREHLFPDFDQVVIHGKAPMTLSLLGLMAESPYAADIAYYLGKHPEQAGAIAKMQPEPARSAVKEIEASVAATNPIHK